MVAVAVTKALKGLPWRPQVEVLEKSFMMGTVMEEKIREKRRGHGAAGGWGIYTWEVLGSLGLLL
uniref:Uncharacterized protein n=1 Tax=Candidozyma auris TaxID=498019 RepID=A0A0L0P0S8_CANAR